MYKLNVAVIYGGMSPEHLISRSSARNVILSLDKEKYNIFPIYINREGHWFMYENYDFESSDYEKDGIGTEVILSTNLRKKGVMRLIKETAKPIDIDIIFPVLHGENGEDGNIQGLLELSDIPYVGCGVLSSAVSADKSVMRMLAQCAGLPQTEYIVFNLHDFVTDDQEQENILDNIEKKLGYPCFVKPCNCGSSIGIGKAKSREELKEKIELASNYDIKIIVEKAVIGREFECGVLGNTEQHDVEISCVGELKHNAEFYSYDAKYRDETSQTIVPADLPKKISEKIRSYSEKMFNIINGSGLARVDFFVEDKTNKVLFNEINTMPGFTSISMYQKLWENSDLSFTNLLDELIVLASTKYDLKKNKLWAKEQ